MWLVLTVSLAICLPLVSATPVPLGKFDVQQYLALVHDINSDGNLSPRIMGGVEVTPHSYPSQVAIFIYVGEDVHFCCGSLVSNRWVLTTASCLTMQHDSIIVLLGDHNLNEVQPPVVIMNATSYIPHEDYDNATYRNDVGLLKLQEEVALTKNIQPVVLANGTDRYDGDNGTIVGWGVAETSVAVTKAEGLIITNDACAEANAAYKEFIQPTHVCTTGAALLTQDIGGPLFVDDVQVGIACYVMPSSSAVTPSVFMRVNDYYDWIKDTITNNTGAPGGAAGLDSLRLGVIVLVALYLAQLLK